MKKKKRKKDYFLRNKHTSDGHCKNKPSYTGTIEQLLLVYNSQILGIHQIQRKKHTVVRKLKVIIQVSINQRGLKTPLSMIIPIASSASRT